MGRDSIPGPSRDVHLCGRPEMTIRISLLTSAAGREKYLNRIVRRMRGLCSTVLTSLDIEVKLSLHCKLEF
jgi:hypothetical protein